MDAPCSATGVIRRHPDIKLCRRQQDIPTLANQQLALLVALWPLLTPGGILLYTTCSILPQENEAVITEFLSSHHNAKTIAITLPIGKPCKHGFQILPGEGGSDGFYYAKLNKSI